MSKARRYKELTKVYLLKEYQEKKLSIRAITKNVGCGKETVRKWLRFYNIERRGRDYHMVVNNPMKDPEVRKRVSKWRREQMPQSMKDRYAAGMRKAWAEGKYDNAPVGRCAWYTYHKRSGEIVKLQGTWELAFCKWMDSLGIEFVAHRGRIPHQMNGVEKSYYPDFWVPSWNSYVDVKAQYFMDLQEDKFAAIRNSNKDKNFKILMKEDLIALGVDLDKG